MSATPPDPFDDTSAGAPPPPPPPSAAPPPPPPPLSSPAPAPAGSPQAPPPGYVSYNAYGASTPQTAIAPAGSRIVARLIDSLIIFVVFFLIGLAFVGGGGFAIGSVGNTEVIGFQLLVLLLGVGWEAAFLATKGATPGKMAMSVKVVYEDGRDLDLPGALRRLSPNIALGLMALVPALVRLSSIINLVITVLSLIWLLSHDRRQTVWDRIATTIVIKD